MTQYDQKRPRVVVTGMGAITPLGDVAQTWAGMVDGQSGIRRVERVVLDHVPVRIGGEIPAALFQPEGYISRKDTRRMPRVAQYAVMAALRACEQAGLTPGELTQPATRTATVIGTTMGPHLLAEEMTSAYRRNGHQRPNPVEFANCLPNMPAHYVSRFLGATGPLHTPIAACATGTQALGLATDMIRMGQADVVIAGATEAILQDYIYAGFASLRALAEGYEDDPSAASRPFDADRGGFVLSEGAAVLVLERLEHAQARGAGILAEVMGHASTADAYHIAAIHPEARGMIDVMRLALADAGLHPAGIGYINAHGSGTEVNDRLETLAIRAVFGDWAREVAISSNKSMLGHAMAAAGAIEASIAIQTLREGIIPPTINLHTPDPACDLDYTPHRARSVGVPLRYVMSNNFGLGGQNASVILGQFPSESP